MKKKRFMEATSCKEGEEGYSLVSYSVNIVIHKAGVAPGIFRQGANSSEDGAKIRLLR